jgi:4-hydroxy-tetrahydrodipicolinate reductase
MTNIIVAGAAGKMSRRIIDIISHTPGANLVGAFERPGHALIGQSVGVNDVIISDSLAAIATRGDVVIDFTAPEATLNNMKIAVDKGLSMVVGTTGITGDILAEVTELVKDIRCVMTPNMSVGVNVLFKIVADVARLICKDYDMEIIEAHHRLKKDAPSGTAMKLAKIVAEAVNRDLDECAVYEREGIIGPRTDKEIGIQTLRAGDIVGEHTVMFCNEGERIELTHKAHNKDNFAKGAVRAALWLPNQALGLYDMKDVLDL